MIEIINIYEFIQETQYIMPYNRLKEETFKRYRYLWEDFKSIMYGVEFNDKEYSVSITIYDPASETRGEIQSKLIYL